MPKQTFRIGALVACATLAFTGGCDRQSSPTAPAEAVTHVLGWVVDPILRPLAGATVRVLDGRLTGTRTDSDAGGRFEVTSRESGPVKLEVSREGFKPKTYTAIWEDIDESGFQIRLELVEATEVPLDPGDYTVMFSFNLPTARDAGHLPPCAGFPADAAKRTFNATVTESPYPDLFDRLVTLEGPTVSRNAQFALAIGQRSVSFGEMENPITEEMPGFRYVNAQFGQRVPDEPVTVADGKVSVPATGFFQYCELYGPERSQQCQSNATPSTEWGRLSSVKFHACVSDDVWVVFTRR